MKPQLGLPAVEGRKQRIAQFKEFVEASRKDKTAQQIGALYSIETGLTPVLLKKYLKLFYEAGLYHEPNWITSNKIVTEDKYGPLYKRYQEKRELKSKMSRYRRLRREKRYIDCDKPLPDDWEEQLETWER